MAFQVHKWERDARNPIFPPGDDFDSTACMNPFVVVRGDEYWLYYAGGGKDNHKRICLAIAKIGDLTNWKRLGPLFDLGAKGAFDDNWCVLPCVHKFKNKWHLYYSGQSSVGRGLQAFHGMGLAGSEDGLKWQKMGPEPIMDGSDFPQFPTNIAIAGGGPIIEIPQPDGGILYRMYYTLPTGTSSKDRKIDQEKHSVIAHSRDGITWFDKKIILTHRDDATYEDCATIALNPWKTKNGWRAIYAGIGTRFGAYSICEARSDDAVNWERGAPEENLAMPPSKTDGDGKWASGMTEYPNVVIENGKIRIFYCGNGYGKTGIGTALADPIEPLV